MVLNCYHTATNYSVNFDRVVDCRQACILLFKTRQTGARCPSGRWPSERWLGMRTGHSRPGSNPTSVKLFRFGTLAIPFTPLCQCLSDETLKAVGPF